jgi:alcohol dehydrogenase class IV
LLRPKVPIFTIPTTPTTAAGKAGTAVTAPGGYGRLAMFDPATRAKSILLDPEYLASSPAGLVRNAALNAFVMAVEGLAAGRSHVFSDASLVHGLKQLAALLPQLASETPMPQLRVDAALAAILVGDGTDTAGGGLTAALSHTIGHRYDAHNGAIDATLLPHVLERMPPGPAAWALIADGLTCAPSQLGARLDEVLSACGAPDRLRDLGVQFDDIQGLAAEASSDFAYRRAAHQLDTDDVADLLRAAW